MDCRDSGSCKSVYRPEADSSLFGYLCQVEEANKKAGSPYVGGRFTMSVDFALDYPFRAPQVCPLELQQR
jgi:ubiquitin-protein ligase